MLDRQYPLRMSEQQRHKLDLVAKADGRNGASWLRWQIEIAYRDLARRRDRVRTEHAS